MRAKAAHRAGGNGWHGIADQLARDLSLGLIMTLPLVRHCDLSPTRDRYVSGIFCVAPKHVVGA
jgi:hypothetical protein